MGMFSWFRRRSQQGDFSGRGSEYEDASGFYIRSDLPDPGYWHIAAQWYVYDASSDAAAERVRDIALGGWTAWSFQVRLPDGRAYWWNSGGLTEEWRLISRTPNSGEYNVVWELLLAHDADDAHGAVQAAGEALEAQAASGSLRLVVVDSQGRAHERSPGPPII